jgi:hypothetical protein
MMTRFGLPAMAQASAHYVSYLMTAGLWIAK